MKGTPRSKQFDDVYFSVDNGFAETHHVFVQGNDLPRAWQEADDFIIGETGFGTGLNFLAAWQLFEQTAKADARLHFLSFEKYPLSREEAGEALSVFKDELGEYITRFLEDFPVCVPSVQRIVFGDRIFLTLVIGDINDTIGDMDAKVDCWFLDGFTPAKNPEMWTDTVFQNMARMSKAGASLATFTAAGDVKRGLKAAGFDVEKRDGFGRKRDMLAGRMPGEKEGSVSRKKSIAIVGGGLAGTSCAFALKRYGFSPVIYERHQGLGCEASGNETGLYNPRFSAFRNAESDFYSSAFWQCLQTVKGFGEIEFQKTGALHLITSDEKKKRFDNLGESWGWPEEELQIIDKKAASEVAGIKIKQDALYLKQSGAVNPHKLCGAYGDGIEVRTGEVSNLDEIKAYIIILCNGVMAKDFVPWLPIHCVRGQVTAVEQTETSTQLKCNLHYGGYISAAKNGTHMVGSTFQKWLTHTDLLPEDHEDNIARLKENITAFEGEDFKIAGGRAGLRTSSQDRFPIAGKVPGAENIYISTAHASHGIVSSLAGANMIADLIAGAPVSQTAETQKALSAQRFIDRAAKKGKPIFQ